MNKIEERFLTLVRSNNMRSFVAAHRVLTYVSTPVLYDAAIELASRARYLHLVDTFEKADRANQLASQIAGLLRQRNQDVTELDATIYENMTKMY